MDDPDDFRIAAVHAIEHQIIIHDEHPRVGRDLGTCRSLYGMLAQIMASLDDAVDQTIRGGRIVQRDA